MKILINNIKMPIRHTTDDVFAAARGIVRLGCVSASDFSIYKQSVDARRKGNIHYVYTVSANCKGAVSGKNITVMENTGEFTVPRKGLSSRPVVIGMGPCGLFAAYILALSGNPPIILERGGDVDSRQKSVNSFWQKGVLDKNSNVQFGEGGAGTFSDGKLNTRIGDKRQKFVLETFVKFGAPAEILYKAKPHIGTDLLCGVIKNMRKELIRMGAEIRFNSTVTDFEINNNEICGIEINNSETVKCKDIILAIGHSSRDTYEKLFQKGIVIDPKPFAMGVRIEHSQKYIDTLQYGGATGLPPADYRVVYNGDGRSCYSFCMCPGGTVVNASSEEGFLAVNGMSNHSRNGTNANSALVVTVNPSDFKDGVLGGIAFQRKYEKLAFELGGNNRAPVQLAEDFVKDIPSTQTGDVNPSVTSGFNLAELKKCLPDFATQTLKEGLCDFERKMPGFASNGAILTGIESRTSAPVRIPRGDGLQSVNTRGLYPSGEGAGYAGGIVSAAVDGIRSALALID